MINENYKICSYHPSEVYLLTFCEDALSVTKQFLVNATNLKERIAALYLMYSVYYKMPTKQLKFRMTLLDWNCLMELRSQVNKEDFLDANYIICKLIVDHAFHFCIADNVVCVLSQNYNNNNYHHHFVCQISILVYVKYQFLLVFISNQI